jgi:proline iminopeptidase
MVSASALLLAGLLTVNVNGGYLDGLYVQEYGNPESTPLMFVHGGPGYYSWDFELTTAQALANLGYFVIVYDERGQGRSQPCNSSEYNYKVYADDIKRILDHYQLPRINLLAHSHGGPIAVQFDTRYPNIADKIVLISAPVKFYGLVSSMFENIASFYQATNNLAGLRNISEIKVILDDNYDTLSDESKTICVASIFGLSYAANLFSPSYRTPEAIELLKKFKENPISSNSGALSAMPGFLKNEDYIHKDYYLHVNANNKRYCGIYGTEDKLFTPVQFGIIQLALESESNGNFALINGSAHAVYIFQQQLFFQALQFTCGLVPSNTTNQSID